MPRRLQLYFNHYSVNCKSTTKINSAVNIIKLIITKAVIIIINKVYSSNDDQKHAYIYADEKYIASNYNKNTIGMLYKDNVKL